MSDQGPKDPEDQEPETPAPYESRFVRSFADEPTLGEQALIDALGGLSLDRFKVVVDEVLSRKAWWMELVEMGVEPPPEPSIEP